MFRATENPSVGEMNSLGEATFGRKLMYVVQHVEGNGPRKPQYWNVDDSGDKLVLLDQIVLKK